MIVKFTNPDSKLPAPFWGGSSLAVWALWGLVCLNGGKAQAEIAVDLVGPDLKAKRIILNRVEDSTMTFFDADGLLQVEPLANYLRWRIAPSDAQAKQGTVVIDLSDGRRWTGEWLGTQDDGQVLLLKHWLFGQVKTDLEKVRRIAFDGSLKKAESTKRDLVILANGDRLTGFINALEMDKVSFQPKGKRQALQLEIKNIRSIHLANPAEAQIKFHAITLTDGSRVLAKRFSVIGQTMSVSLITDQDASNANTGNTGVAPVAIPLKKVSRVDLADPSRRLVDLSALPSKTLAGGKVFGLAMPVRAQGTAFRMHAPVTVQFELPPGAVRFSAEAQLDVDSSKAESVKGNLGKANSGKVSSAKGKPGRASSSESARSTRQGSVDRSHWADFVVKVRVDDVELESYHIHTQQRRVRINVAAKGRVLTIELDPGRNGPVMDRLYLTNAIILAAIESGAQK
jgi:hypothetical protein